MTEKRPYRCTVCGRVWQRVVRITRGKEAVAQVVNVGRCNRCGGLLVEVLK